MTWAEIDLDAISHNAASLKAAAGDQAELMVTVKANAYGHGMVPVAKAALQGGASQLAVHRTLEGVRLREGGIAAPILIMGYNLPSESEQIVHWDLTPTVNSEVQAKGLSEAVVNHRRRFSRDWQGAPYHHNRTLPVHLEVDTGMARYGLLPQEVVGFARTVRGLPGIEVQGLYTHFAVADSADKSFTRYQFRLFAKVLRELAEAGIRISVKHVANSAATLDLPEMALDMVRCGIALYGLHPSDEVEPAVALRPAMSLKGRVARVRTLPAGSSVSYGRTFVTQRSTCVALVPIGYGDGYHRFLSNRGEVLVNGQRAPILGRVCMDQFVVDVSHIPGVNLHDEVVLIGRQGMEHIPAEEVARWAQTINYEVTTSLLPRVTRVFLRQGEEVERLTT